MRLLVVEDDPDLNRQLVSALGDAGYVVDSATDGEEGHYLGDTEPYDAVILDIGSWWLARFAEPFIYVIAAAGAIFGIAYALQILGILGSMWLGRGEAEN